MLDEVQVPKPPRLFTCPCCVFSFTGHEKFVAHCEEMKAKIQQAIADSSKPVKKA